MIFIVLLKMITFGPDSRLAFIGNNNALRPTIHQDIAQWSRPKSNQVFASRRVCCDIVEHENNAHLFGFTSSDVPVCFYKCLQQIYPEQRNISVYAYSFGFFCIYILYSTNPSSFHSGSKKLLFMLKKEARKNSVKQNDGSLEYNNKSTRHLSRTRKAFV